MCDLKCPGCQLWYSATGGDLAYTDTGYIIECAQCKKKTQWRTDIAPVPLLFSNYPLEIEKLK